jgi:plastocyanin domain-containing protein
MTKILKATLAAVLLLSSAGSALAAPVPRTVQMTVTKEGFVPAEVKVRKGEPLKLVITRKVQRTCATEVVIEGTGIKKDLPLDQAVEIEFTPGKAGKIKYACAMGMIGGVLVVE